MSLRNHGVHAGKKTFGRAGLDANNARPRILIVSADRAARAYLARLLSGRWNIATANCSADALKSAATRRPRLVLCDLEHGDESMQLLRELKADSRTKELPVMLLSHGRKVHLAAQALEAGAVDFVRRPVSGRELAARVNVQLTSSRPLSSANRARAIAERSLRASDMFVMQLLHELRNPLNAVIEWTALLQSGRLRTSVRSHAHKLIASSARLQQRLLEDLRDERRLTRGMLSLNCELLTGLGPAIKVVVDSCRPATTSKDILLRSFIAANTGPVKVDVQRLQQALWNLLANAIKFTPPGGSITVRCFATPSSIDIQVSDSGVGITRQAMPHIFKPFRRATELSDGLGLGLSIAKGITKLHNGTISVASDGIGRGATFTIRLPLANAADLSGTHVIDSPDVSADTTALRILLAEDHFESAQALQRLLSMWGHQVLPAKSVAEAVALATESPPDLLVCDFNLKDGTAVELLARIRGAHSETEANGLPAILMSGYIDAASRARTRAVGFNLHLEKPVDPQLLRVAVQQALALPSLTSVGRPFVNRPPQRRRGYDSDTRR